MRNSLKMCKTHIRWKNFLSESKPVFILLLVSSIIFLGACSKEPTKPVLPDPDPVDTSTDGGTGAFSLEVIDMDVKNFMKKFNIPGLSLAVTRYGKLVYAKGYGYANKETLEKVDTGSLFRIASLSKFITSTAIMQLIEKGEFSINDKVFGTGAVLGTIYGTQPYKEGVSDITVSDLLHHTVGGWGNAHDDPQFNNPSLSAEELISWTIDNVPLANTPGTKAAYSNFGYCILGRIVENVSGQSFVDYVKEHIFEPAGVKNMVIGSATYAGRKTNEVKYYGNAGANPYGYNSNVFARLDAVGAWVASATDLLRIMVRIDGFATVPDMLQPSTIQLMASTTPHSGRYACGLYISSTGNWFHGGALTGTRTWIVRSKSGYCWSILMNTRLRNNSDFETGLDHLVWPAVNAAATPWPDVDLF